MMDKRRLQNHYISIHEQYSFTICGSNYIHNYSQEIHDGRNIYQIADFNRIYSRELHIAPPHAPVFPASSERRHQFPTLQTRYPKNKMRRRRTISRVEPPSQDRKKKRLFFWYTPEDLYNTIRHIIFIYNIYTRIHAYMYL